MTESKADLKESVVSMNLINQKSLVKDEGMGGSAKENLVMSLLNESKDQVATESNIPLSPQWLYSKPIEPTTFMTAVSGGSRGQNLVFLGTTPDFSQKESLHLDGSQEKKEWRKPTSEIESTRRWHEEERETSLHGRRDLKKEDNRNSVHETRRDKKWSSRWGPENREMESKTVRRGEIISDDKYVEKQPIVGHNRTVFERDNPSRDKWRPRHRMEVQAIGSVGYRASAGFALERGILEGSTVGFGLGRGRPNFNGTMQFGRSSSVAPIGSGSVEKNDNFLSKSGFSTGAYRYPRGKILDIYRKIKIIPDFGTVPSNGMELISEITRIGFMEPLAFVAPDSEEEAVLGDIWKGKITNSEHQCNSFSNQSLGLTGNETDIIYITDNNSLARVGVFESVPKDSVTDTPHGKSTYEEVDMLTLAGVMATDISVSKVNKGYDFSSAQEIVCSGNSIGESKDLRYQVDQEMANSMFPKVPDVEDIKPEASCTQLPDDSCSLFDFPSSYHLPSNDQHYLKEPNESLLVGRVNLPDELSLFYLDPQGVIQGPFLGIDIISWLEQGFFGTDLPVRLLDAPDEAPFQPLEKIMPRLKMISNTNEVNKLEQQSFNFRDSMEESLHNPTLGMHDPIVPKKIHSMSPYSEHHGLQHEEIVFTGLPGSINSDIVNRTAANVNSIGFCSTSHPLFAYDATDINILNHKDNELHPFGLLMSEHSVNNMMRGRVSGFPSIVGDPLHERVDRDAVFLGHGSFNVDQPSVVGTWTDDYRRNTFSNPNLHPGITDPRHLTHIKNELNGLDVREHLMSRKLKNEESQLWNHLLRHPTSQVGSGVEQFPGYAFVDNNNPSRPQSTIRPVPDLDHLSDLQFQQQQQRREQFEYQQIHKIQQQILHQDMKIQQQRQEQSQVQQLFREQLLHQQQLDPSRENFIDQVLVRNRILNELQQNSHASRHLDPSMEQFMQVKMGHAMQQGRMNEFSELIAKPKHGNNIINAEQQLCYQQQLHAWHLPMELRHAAHQFDRTLSAHQFDRTLSAQHRSQPGFNALNFHQQQKQSDMNENFREQFNHPDWNVSLLEQHQQEFYDPRSALFDRKLDSNSGFQGLDIQAQNPYLQNLDHLASFSSGPSNPSRVFDQFQSPQIDAVGNSWLGAHMEQLHLGVEQQKKEAEFSALSCYSKGVLRDTLHENLGMQSTQFSEKNYRFPSSYERGDQLWSFTESTPADHFPDQQVGLNNSVEPHQKYTANLLDDQLVNVDVNAQFNDSESNERFILRSKSGSLTEDSLFSSSFRDNSQANYLDSNLIRMPSEDMIFSEDPCAIHKSIPGISEKSTEGTAPSVDYGDFLASTRSRHISHADVGGNGGVYYYDIGLDKFSGENICTKRLSSKVPDRILTRNSGSSHEASLSNQKSSSSLATFDDGRNEFISEQSWSYGKKEANYRQFSSLSDSLVSETSFMDMLKKSVAPDDDLTVGLSVVDSSDGGGQGGRGKKKGKKGRQIDPALLGFKVSSNRIMMGEIQRLDE